MARYWISYSDGREIECQSESLAREEIEAEYPDAEYGDDWEPYDGGERMLVWADEDDSLGDSGVNAIASIHRAQ